MKLPPARRSNFSPIEIQAVVILRYTSSIFQRRDYKRDIHKTDILKAYGMESRAALALDLETKRRKVRKGTHSCWECKRRKVRCVFAASTDPICITCRRRGTKCISQELPDEKSQVNDNVGRIVRVEALLNQLVQSVNHADQDSEISPSTRDCARAAAVTSSSSGAARIAYPVSESIPMTKTVLRLI